MYSVYWYQFSGYKGKSLTKQNKGKYPYLGLLYKTGHQKGEEEFGRVEKNLERDLGLKPTWYELWTEIRCLGIIKGLKTKEEARKVEEDIQSQLGPKDFNLYENISGITEFRIASLDRKIILERFFNK
tara:strand:- start:28 stop:411 length:384 start_codon:yes stop_codon:yes gene_type:complete